LPHRARPQVLRPELIDQDGLSDSELEGNLRDLRRVHRWFGGRGALQPVMSWIERQPAGSQLRLLDVGCGGGDGLRDIARHAAQHRIEIQPIGLDRNDRVLRFADRSRPSVTAAWVLGDATRLPFRDACFDLVYCALLLHHLPDPRVPALLRELWRLCRRALIVVELRRSRLARALVATGAALSRRGRVTRHDGPLSIAQGFRAGELSELARRAGLPPARIARCFWFRLVLWVERESTSAAAPTPP